VASPVASCPVEPFQLGMPSNRPVVPEKEKRE
jgi:hypothetical protein